MSDAVDRAVLAERVATVTRHLDRVADRLPTAASQLRPMDDATDAVILHLWQAFQITIDVAVSHCVTLGLGAPTTYGDAFRRLGDAGVIDRQLAARLGRAAGFRNLIVHAYADLDLEHVHVIAKQGPRDLMAFFAALTRR